MIENTTNIIQMIAVGLCAATGFWNGHVSHKKTWVLLGFMALVFFLGDLYWQLYLISYGRTPYYSHIPYYSWYASYVFLLLLIQALREGRPNCKSRFVLIVPLFTAGMALFYMQWGDYVSNIVSAFLMTFLLLNCIDGLIYVYSPKYADVTYGTAGERSAGLFYIAVMMSCIAEYGSWTSSCIWTGDTLANPYFWFDMLLSVSILIMPAALRKAVGI